MKVTATMRICKTCKTVDMINDRIFVRDLCDKCSDEATTKSLELRKKNAQVFMDRHKKFLLRLRQEELKATAKYYRAIYKIDKKLDAFCKKHGYKRGSFLATLGEGEYFGFNINECRYNDNSKSFLIHYSDLERGTMSDV
jgi:hypothetical protein